MNSLKRHQIFHKQEKPFKYGICQSTFKRKDHLHRHQSSTKCKQPLTEKKVEETFPFKCEPCGKEFKYFSLFKRHQRIHAGEKQSFQCAICQKNFDKKYSLNRHQETHKKEKRFKCDICHKNFGYKDTLKAHEKRHESEKPYKCEKSKKTLTSHDKVKNHLRVNVNEKPCSSANSKYLKTMNTVIIQNSKNDSTKYLLNKSNPEDTFDVTLKTTNLELTFQQQLQAKENMHFSMDSSKSVEQSNVLEDNAKKKFTTELCNISNFGINAITNLQTNGFSAAIMNLDQTEEIYHPTLSEVDSLYKERISQTSEDNLGDVNQTINATEHKITSTNELNNEVCVKSNNLLNLKTHENAFEQRKLDKCDRCSFSSYDSTKVDLHYMDHFDENSDLSDSTNNA